MQLYDDAPTLEQYIWQLFALVRKSKSPQAALSFQRLASFYQYMSEIQTAMGYPTELGRKRAFNRATRQYLNRVLLNVEAKEAH